MLKQKPHLVNKKDSLQNSALHWAAKRGYAQMIEILRAYGADFTATDETGRTASQLTLSKENKANEIMTRINEGMISFRKQNWQAYTRRRVFTTYKGCSTHFFLNLEQLICIVITLISELLGLL